MTAEITREQIEALSGEQFMQVKGWMLEDDKRRTDKHKQETLAKIRELARSIDIGVRIEGVRGRPAKTAANSDVGKRHL